MKKIIGYLSIALVALLIAVPSYAGPITVDAGWYGFCFGGAGSPASEGCQNSGIGECGNPISFTATSAVLFKITDAFDYGDNFQVWINNALALTTPVVESGSGSVSDPDTAFSNPAYSSGSLLLPAGIYTIEVYVVNSPYSGGGAYLEVETASVPEPATMLLFGAGLIGLAGLRRKFA